MIELLRFRLRPGVAVEDFLAADRAVQTGFAYRQPGLLRRTTARGDDGWWVVVDRWAGEAEADACEARWAADPVAQAFMAFLDPDSVRTERYRTLD